MLNKNEPEATSFSFDALVLLGNRGLDSSLSKSLIFVLLKSIGIP